jgi:hypothetical protein
MSSQPTLYERVLGNQYDTLSPAVARFHRLQGRIRIQGECAIEAARHPLLRTCARWLRLPLTDARQAFHFTLDAGPKREIWCRHFPDREMKSRLFSSPSDQLFEQLGIAKLEFDLHVEDGRLSMQLRSVRVAGIPLPMRWMPEIWAFEIGSGSRFEFDVGARWKRCGTLVAYRGHLDLESVEALP